MPQTPGKSHEPEPRPQIEKKHPDEYERDLNPGYMAGQNISPYSDRQEQNLRTAYDDKALHRALADAFRDDELKQIPLLPAGTRLQQGATYADIARLPAREITATGEMSVDAGQRYVPKDRVPYTIWNRLIGEPKPGQ